MSEEGKEGYDSADSNDLEPKRDPTDQANRHEGLEQWLRPETPPEVADRLRQLEIVSVERSISYAGPLPLNSRGTRMFCLAQLTESCRLPRRSNQSDPSNQKKRHRLANIGSMPLQ